MSKRLHRYSALAALGQRCTELEELNEERARVSAEVDSLVRKALEAGAGTSQVGQLLGISRQTVYRRYADAMRVEQTRSITATDGTEQH